VKFEFWVFVKGVLMGAADIVPGVSGGTVAFITGIYERLLKALQAILPSLLFLVRTRSLSEAWERVDGTFLLTLFSGILISVISLAKAITYLLLVHPIPLWSGFFGLIIASVYIIAKEIQGWNAKLFFFTSIGAISAWSITQMSPASMEQNVLNTFLSGLLAICAMVLPGISGSFILVMLGSYAFILSAIKDFDILTLGVFASGCLVGLISIANVLVWAFARHKYVTLAVLTGFMLGALNKIWPWKEVLSFRENRHGELVPLAEQNILPSTYENLTNEPSQLFLAIVCALGSGALIVLLAKVATKSNRGV